MLVMMQRLCSIILYICSVYGFYQIFMGLHLFGKIPALEIQSSRVNRFAVVICAKNEEKVIRQLLVSLRKQKYPANAFDIFVIADNCTDQTASVAASCGAKVFERFNPLQKGKGYALNWFFDRFAHEQAHVYDACIIFDADNLADAGFLAAMNRQVNAGHPIAVGYRLGKNPSSSWVAGCSSLFWLIQTRALYITRARMHLPCCSVGGTGFMFCLSVLGQNGWNTRSICEDIEFTLNSIAAGYHVSFAGDAIFYDEQPLSLEQSIRQRYRWSLGSIQVISICTPKLFRSMIQGNLRQFDAFLYSLGTAVMGISGIFWLLLLVMNVVATGDWLGLAKTVMIATLSGLVITAAFVCLVLVLERKSWPGVWKAILTFPFYLFTWSLINIVVLFYRRSVWHGITHQEDYSIESMSGSLATPILDDPGQIQNQPDHQNEQN